MIFSHLSDNYRINSGLSRVCKRWYEANRSTPLQLVDCKLHPFRLLKHFREINTLEFSSHRTRLCIELFTEKNKSLFTDMVKSFKTLAPRSKAIHIEHHCDHTIIHHFLTFLSKGNFQHLEKLKLIILNKSQPSLLIPLPLSTIPLPSLSSLTVSYDKLTNELLRSLLGPNTTQLHIVLSEHITNEICDMIPQNITKLILIKSTNKKVTCINDILEKCGSTLTYLHTSFRVSASVIDTISKHCKNITTLKLTSCQSIDTHKFHQLVTHCMKIENLILHQASSFTYDHIAVFEDLKVLPNLKLVDLDTLNVIFTSTHIERLFKNRNFIIHYNCCIPSLGNYRIAPPIEKFALKIAHN